jgi:hypothetical protein
MLKIKVSIYLSATTGVVIHTPWIASGNVRSQGGENQGKKHFAAYICAPCLILSQEAAHKIIVRLFYPLPFVSRGKAKNKGSSFATGLELQEKRKRVLVISTGSKAVDSILGGKSRNTNC